MSRKIGVAAVSVCHQLCCFLLFLNNNSSLLLLSAPPSHFGQLFFGWISGNCVWWTQGLNCLNLKWQQLHTSISHFTVFVFGQVLPPHHSDQMSQRSQMFIWRCSLNVFVFVFFGHIALHCYNLIAHRKQFSTDKKYTTMKIIFKKKDFCILLRRWYRPLSPHWCYPLEWLWTIRGPISAHRTLRSDI